ncbi:MAG: hypothetical protein K0R98_959 [Rickettsiaceae bacterium]|jgi:hypothetical protein|nr:hypothetical protein [Rickettsiaceae bacterium]
MKPIYLIIIGILLAFTQKADAAGLFTINNIEVSSDGDSAKQAKDNAITSAYNQAYKQLLGRIITSTPEDKWPSPNQEELSELVRGFDIVKEKVTQKHYKATLNVTFRKELIEKLLQVNKIEYVSTVSDPVIILPLFSADGTDMLWEESNPWAISWKKALASGGYTKFIVPQSHITVEQLSSSEQSDKDALSTLMDQYSSKKLLLAKASKTENNGLIELVVTLTYLNSEIPETSNLSFKAETSTDTLESLMQKAATQIISDADAKWKQAQTISQSSGSQINVNIPISSLDEWNNIRKSISGLGFIKSMRSKYITVGYVSVDFNFEGNYQDLATNFQNHGFTLEQKDNGYFLYAL